MEWIDKTDTFEERKWKDKYLEICEVLDDEIYVSYGIMYGIVYVHKNDSVRLQKEIKQVIYNDYMKNGYSEDMPTDEFINRFHTKYNIQIPYDIFF